MVCLWQLYHQQKQRHCNTQSQNSQKTFKYHSAVADFLHILSLEIVLEDVPEDTRLWKPDTAPQATVTKKWIVNMSPDFSLWKPVNIGRFIVGCDSKQTNNSGDDHACKHKGCHVISRLHQNMPDWQNSGQEDVSKNDVSIC